jgi:hypothetical protein
MTFDEFTQKLAAKIRKTDPSPAGLWTRYLEESCPDLDSFVADLCSAFLKGRGNPIRNHPDFANNPDVVWYLATFVKHQAQAIKTKSDNDSLVLGLAATAILAEHSDPRDVTIWIDDLYQAARDAGIAQAQAYFERVAALLPDQNEFVAQRIRTYPAVFEKFELDKARRRKGDSLQRA